MGIEFGGTHGEIRNGSKVVARLTSWNRNGRQIDFAIDPKSVNEYWASYGAPTAVALAVKKTRTLVYEVEEGGDFRAGALTIKADSQGKPQPPRVETT